MAAAAAFDMKLTPESSSALREWLVQIHPYARVRSHQAGRAHRTFIPHGRIRPSKNPSIAKRRAKNKAARAMRRKQNR